MERNKYLFCGCSVEIKSDEPIYPDAEFSYFLSDFPNADYSIRIIKTDSLPPADGNLIFSSDRRKIYCGKDTKVYTSYYDAKLHKYIDFACKINDSELYMNYDVLRDVGIFEAIDLPSMLMKKGVGIIHCSFIEHNGKAILFVGDKQVGKSTQAALWNKYENTDTINGDRAAISYDNGIFYANGIPFCGTSKICKNKSFPIKALVCLSIGNRNEIKRLSSMEAFIKLIGKFTYNSISEEVEMITNLTQKMAEHLPVFMYSCLKDESAVTYLKDELSKYD